MTEQFKDLDLSHMRELPRQDEDGLPYFAYFARTDTGQYAFSWQGDYDHPVDVSCEGANGPVHFRFSVTGDEFHQVLTKWHDVATPQSLAKVFRVMCERWIEHHDPEEDM